MPATHGGTVIKGKSAGHACRASMEKSRYGTISDPDMRPLIASLLFSLLLASTPAFAGTTTVASAAKPATAAKSTPLRCHDKSGKFVACPKDVAKHNQCRDAKGKFIACPKKVG